MNDERFLAFSLTSENEETRGGCGFQTLDVGLGSSYDE